MTLEQLSLIANHAAMLSAKDAWIYDAGATPIWDISIMPLSGFFAPSTSHNDGSFSIDFSLATSYAIKITDTNGSETTISPFVVNPDVVITTPTTAPGYYADTFCSTATLPDLSCPDGANRRVTTLDKAPV